MDTATSAAMTAENKPFYLVVELAHFEMNSECGTHKDDDPISILLPSFGHLIVFFLCMF